MDGTLAAEMGNTNTNMNSEPHVITGETGSQEALIALAESLQVTGVGGAGTLMSMLCPHWH